MFGFACNETKRADAGADFLRAQSDEGADQGEKGRKVSWLRPDGKSQVSVQYGEHGGG